MIPIVNITKRLIELHLVGEVVSPNTLVAVETFVSMAIISIVRRTCFVNKIQFESVCIIHVVIVQRIIAGELFYFCKQNDVNDFKTIAAEHTKATLSMYTGLPNYQSPKFLHGIIVNDFLSTMIMFKGSTNSYQPFTIYSEMRYGAPQ